MRTNGNPNWPQFICIGAAKAGTTSLHHYLSQHPSIYLHPEKELWFWHLNRNPNKSIQRYFPKPERLEDYLKCFEACGDNQIAGEICPSYLCYPDLTIASLRELHPYWQDLKLFAILRHPLERLKSNYLMIEKLGLDPRRLTLEECILRENEARHDNLLLPDLNYVANSMYHWQLQPYFEAFKHIKVFLYDDLCDSPQALIQEVFEFIGVDPQVSSQINYHNRANVTGRGLRPRNRVWAALYSTVKRGARALPRSVRRAGKGVVTAVTHREPDTSISESTSRRLQECFRGDLEQLQLLIDRDLSAWIARL